MNRLLKCIFFLYFVMLGGCVSVGIVKPMSYETQGSIQDNMYNSPSGRFRIQIPPLLKPGAKVRDEAPIDGVWLVSFMDDLCREYVVTERLGRLDDQSIETWVDENVVSKLASLGASLQERRTIQTRYGPAIFLRYRHPGAGPCTVTMISEGKTVITKTDADVGMYILYIGEYFYRFIYVLGDMSGAFEWTGVERKPVDRVLSRFVEGFKIMR